MIVVMKRVEDPPLDEPVFVAPNRTIAELEIARLCSQQADEVNAARYGSFQAGKAFGEHLKPDYFRFQFYIVDNVRSGVLP